MAKYPITLKMWTGNADQVQVIREPVKTFNGGISDFVGHLEKEEVIDGATWVTVSVENAQQAYLLGRRVGQLMMEGGQYNG